MHRKCSYCVYLRFGLMDIYDPGPPFSEMNIILYCLK